MPGQGVKISDIVKIDDVAEATEGELGKYLGKAALKLESGDHDRGDGEIKHSYQTFITFDEPIVLAGFAKIKLDWEGIMPFADMNGVSLTIKLWDAELTEDPEGDYNKTVTLNKWASTKELLYDFEGDVPNWASEVLFGDFDTCDKIEIYTDGWQDKGTGNAETITGDPIYIYNLELVELTVSETEFVIEGADLLDLIKVTTGTVGSGGWTENFGTGATLNATTGAVTFTKDTGTGALSFEFPEEVEDFDWVKIYIEVVADGDHDQWHDNKAAVMIRQYEDPAIMGHADGVTDTQFKEGAPAGYDGDRYPWLETGTYVYRLEWFDRSFGFSWVYNSGSISTQTTATITITKVVFDKDPVLP